MISVKFRRVAVAGLGAILLGGLSHAAHAADTLDIGRGEYEAACAACHGGTGRGDGPMKSLLVKPTPDLTLLAKNNRGVFPFDRVYQMIDGRQESEIPFHGTREMPIWGHAFSNKSSIYYKENPPYDTEYTTRSRILALIEYLHRLQRK